MKVSTASPFQIIYSLFEHEYLGFLFESFVVQLDAQDRLTLQHQNISAMNADEFASHLDETDFKLIKLMDAIQQDVVVKKHNTKKINTAEFFLKIFNKEKGDKGLQEAVLNYVEKKKAEIFPLLKDKVIFEMGNDGEPTWKRLHMAEEPSTVLFHFRRNEDNTHYFPTIKFKGEKLDFQYKNAMIVCKEPAWLLLGNCLYHFSNKELDGNKIRPFLNKKFITIPKAMEETYYKKFVVPLVASFDVYAKGFTINTESYPGKPVLTYSGIREPQAGGAVLALNGASGSGKHLNGSAHKEESDEKEMVFGLNFMYDKFKFPAEFHQQVSVSLEKTDDSYIFHRVKRNREWEKNVLQELKGSGLDIRNSKTVLPKWEALEWMLANVAKLREAGYIIEAGEKQKEYFEGESTINLEISENRDWFDINAIVKFGDIEIPFLKLRNLILQKKKEFELPNGKIGIIPDAWFARYSELFAFTEENTDDNTLKLKSHHLSLVQELEQSSNAEVTMNRKLEKLSDFESIEDQPLPENFNGTLRPYQKAGFNWMLFLNKYRFGGCLADDMGLGKTVQTLALLQHQKENSGIKAASLLIMPTSLIYNWEMEAKRFTPSLKVFTYTGTNREKDVSAFDYYDLILTSYGIIRLDIDILKTYQFNYIILDESQAIKNPTSNIAKAVRKLNSQHRLVLTGTPIENNTMDLWSQMSFVNPGLLGAQTFFRNEFLTPIEKKKDVDKKLKLNSIIKPFILRRHKSQVARELPEKVENVQYCNMSEDQEKLYEEAKSYYRNKILEHIEEKGFAQSQIVLLQGLTQLRQLANHPRMVDEAYGGDSGKLEDVLDKLKSIVSEDHKVLVFSQFVKHLSIIKNYLQEEGIPFAYLDGSTKNRQGQVENFQHDENIKVFLISLKAGGVGLNLTAADYVFILDPWWNPAIEAQAIDRAHRIGQDKKVFTYKFISRNTVEEKILSLQQSKQQLANELINTEESFVKTLSKEDIVALLE
jgi:SNF2 family DNA or RNA helicase